MIPNGFEYKEMFEHVVIGNIILSTFIYAFILGIIFIKNKDKFKQECEEEEANH
jgi:CPA1 family monovalent cation:H+ antiporter